MAGPTVSVQTRLRNLMFGAAWFLIGSALTALIRHGGDGFEYALLALGAVLAAVSFHILKQIKAR